MSQEKISQKTIEELDTREKELRDIIDKARGVVENLSDKKMSALGSRIEEEEYFNQDTTKGTDVQEVEEASDEEQHKGISAIRRKIQRENTQEKKKRRPIEEDKIFRETTQKLTKQDTEIANHLNAQVKADMIEEVDDLLTRTDEHWEMEEKEVGEIRKQEEKKQERELTRRASKWLGALANEKDATKEIYQPTEEELIDGIADLLKNHKISEVIVSGGRNENKIVTWGQDLDSLFALWLFNNFNKKGGPKKIYAEGARSTILDTKGGEKEPQEKMGGGRVFIDAGVTWLKEEPQEKVEGVRVFIDAGGTWLKIENDHQKTTTIRIDHHGVGQRDATSGTQMLYKIMDKADLLKDKPEWLTKFVNFVNEVDNLTYLENVDSNNKKVFNEEYFKNAWPKTLYAISREIPFDILLKLFKSEKIKDPSVPFTDEELQGKLGKTKVGEFTIAELCERALVGDKSKKEKNIGGAINTLKGVEDCQRYAKQEKLNLENTSLGKIIYQNFGKIKTNDGKYYMAKIEKALAFIGTKAVDYNTFINWNAVENEFFINSNHPDLSKIVEKLNEADPDCAVDVRGVMVFGQIKNLTEEQFLNIIDPNILKKPEDKDTSMQEEEKGLTPEEEKILEEAEAKIKAEDAIITEAEDKLKKLYAELKVAQFREKKEAEFLAKRKAENKKIKVVKTPKKTLKKKTATDDTEASSTEKENAGPETEDVPEETTEPETEVGVEEPKTDMEKNDKVESFSPLFIREKIISLLKKVDQIDEVKNLEVLGNGNKIVMKGEILAQKGKTTIEINATFTNNKGEIVTENPQINAGNMIKTAFIKGLINPYLKNISKVLKETIEKKLNKKVEKIWIEDGELKAL